MGVNVTANIQLNIREIRTTQNRSPVNSAVLPGAKPMGPKAIIPTKVPPKSGHLVPSTISLTISIFLRPLCIPTKIPSVTTIALSTIIPNAMMSAPSEMRCIGIPPISIVASVAPMVSNKIAPIISADCKPIKRNSVTMTITNAAITLATKFFTEASTISP